MDVKTEIEIVSSAPGSMLVKHTIYVLELGSNY